MVRALGKLKKFLCVLAVLLLAVSFAGCGVYTPPQNEGDNQSGPTAPVDPNPSTPEDPGNSEDPVVTDGFTVTLSNMGVPFTSLQYPRITELQAQWTEIKGKNDTSPPETYRANFNKDGVATRPDLDGDYKVTLVSLPSGYTYEPNSYEATNDSKYVYITLYKLTALPAQPNIYMNSYPFYTIESTGAYRVTLKDRTDRILFSYKPPRQGLYTVNSMVDITANEVNPKMDVHYGILPHYMNPNVFATQDGGGKENTYTKNFYWEYTISIDEVSNGLIFEVYSTSNAPDEIAYPLDVDFIIDREGEFANRYQPSTIINAEEDFSQRPDKPAGTFTYFVKRNGVTGSRLDQKMVKLNPEDGYYHYYDSATDTYGDLLCAKISASNQVTGALSSAQGLNYLMATPTSEPKYYIDFVAAYAAHTYADGCYPVTEELKVFLQDYARALRLFKDGFGIAEKPEENVGGVKYNSDEDSMWLFACGYYS